MSPFESDRQCFDAWAAGVQWHGRLQYSVCVRLFAVPEAIEESAVAGVIISASSGIDLLRGSGPGHQQAKHEPRP